MKDFLEIVRSRKSVRSFLPDVVPRSLIEQILDVAVQAPTNCNQQLWNFIVIDDPAVKEKLVTEAAGNTMFRRAPVLIAVTYDGWNHKEAIQGASLAVGHIILAATYFGVSASPVNSYGADSKVKKVLGIPKYETICCFITLGFPDERANAAPPVPRKIASEVSHWNMFQKKVRAPFIYNPNDWSLEELRFHQRHYCRKTFLGKEMDLAGSKERELVRSVLQKKMGPFLDLMSYDGSYLQLFPEGNIATLDLAPEIEEYTRHAAMSGGRQKVSTYTYDVNASVLPGNPKTITLLYKAERLSDEMLKKLFSQAYETLPKDGELVIVARRRYSLFSVFLSALAFLFGSDVRKTGIYAFFGPYRPVRVGNLMTMAKKAKFNTVEWHGYFAFPSFFEQLYQMIVQYRRSEGSSYLHRDRRRDGVSKSIDYILAAQGFTRSGIFGSVAVIQCKK